MPAEAIYDETICDVYSLFIRLQWNSATQSQGCQPVLEGGINAGGFAFYPYLANAEMKQLPCGCWFAIMRKAYLSGAIV